MGAIPMTIKYFDTLEYVQKAKEIKEPEALAEYQVKQMESAIEAAVQHIKEEIHQNHQELATKTDLQIEVIKIQKEIALIHERIGRVEERLINVEERLFKVEERLVKIEEKIGTIQYEMLKYIIKTGVAVVVVLGGMLIHGFHWI